MAQEGFNAPFESNNKNFSRANKVSNLLHSGECKTFPVAARRVIVEEGITFPPDVKRIISEISAEFHKRKEINNDWNEIDHEIALESAEQMRVERGGDPED